MYQHKKAKFIVFSAATIFSLVFYSTPALAIDYRYDDIENITKYKNYNEIESCANQGSPSCLALLGAAYQWGVKFKDKTIERNINISSNYLSKALGGNLMARTLYAYMISEKAPLEKKSLLYSAATEGYLPAIFGLANSYGIKTDKDRLENIRWRKIHMNIDPSAAQDEKGAIGVIYLTLASPDYPNALYWLNKAAIEEDDMSAQYKLAGLFARGNGVRKDYITAYMYYDLSGSAGSEEKFKLSKLMSQEQVQEAIERSHQWQDKYNSYRPGYGAWNDVGGIQWRHQ